MNLQEFMEKTNKVKRIDGHDYQEIRPKIVCKDGIRLSVQGSENHYCRPRVNNYCFYSEVEVGYPSIRPPECWRQYYDGEWQELGIKGYLKKIYENKSRIWHEIKKIVTRDATRLDYYFLKILMSTKDIATIGVYGYIPIELVESFIEDHGGIDEEKTFNKNKIL